MKNSRRKYIKIIFITLLLFVFVISGCSKKVEVSEEFDYDGELKGNLANGQGKFYENGVLKYEGEIKEGMPAENGTYYDTEGKVINK